MLNRLFVFSLISSIALFGCGKPAEKNDKIPQAPSVCNKSKALQNAYQNLVLITQHNTTAIAVVGVVPATEDVQKGWLTSISSWATSTYAYLGDLAKDVDISATANATLTLVTQYAEAAKMFIDDAIKDPSKLTTSVKEAFWAAQKNLTESMQNMTAKIATNIPLNEINEMLYIQVAIDAASIVSTTIASAATGVYNDPLGTVKSLYNNMVNTISKTTGLKPEVFSELMNKALLLHNAAVALIPTFTSNKILDEETDQKLDELNNVADAIMREISAAIEPCFTT